MKNIIACRKCSSYQIRRHQCSHAPHSPHSVHSHSRTCFHDYNIAILQNTNYIASQKKSSRNEAVIGNWVAENKDFDTKTVFVCQYTLIELISGLFILEFGISYFDEIKKTLLQPVINFKLKHFDIFHVNHYFSDFSHFIVPLLSNAVWYAVYKFVYSCFT